MFLFESLNIENQLLLQIARHQVGRADHNEIVALLQKDLDWEILIRKVLMHKLMPALHNTFLELNSKLVPAELLESIATTYEKNRLRNLAIIDEITCIKDAVDALNLPILAFKGPTFAQQAYGDIAQRTAGDIDILLHKKDVSVFNALLKQRGFRHPYAVMDSLSPKKQQAYQKYQCEYLLIRQTDQMMVEPHWDFNPWTLAIDINIHSIWRRSIEIELNSIKIKTLHPEDHFLIMCIHSSKDIWNNFRALCDIACFLDSHPELDIEFVLERAKSQACLRMVLLGLLLIRKVLGTEKISIADYYIEKDVSLQALSNQLIKTLFLDERKDYNVWLVNPLRLKLREKKTDQVRSLVRTITTPRIQHFQIINLPDYLHWLYYPIKLLYDYLLIHCWKLIKKARKIPLNSYQATDLEKAQSHAFWRSKANAWGKNATSCSEQANKLNQQLIDMTGILPNHRVLDIAGGAGDPSLYISDVVGKEGKVISTDIVPEILDFSRQLALESNIQNINYCVADIDALPFKEKSFDIVVSRFGLMFCKDEKKTLNTIRSILKPNGRIGLIVWGERGKNQIFDICLKVYTDFFGLKDRDPTKGPFSLSKPGKLKQHLFDAGFNAVDEIEMLIEITEKKDSPFWQPVIEKSINIELNQLPKKTKTELDKAMEKAFRPFIQGEQYHFTNLIRIAVGTA